MLLLALLLATLAMVASNPGRALAQGTVDTYDVTARLDEQGVLRVEQTMTYEGAAPGTVEQRFATRENAVGDAQYVYRLTDVTVTAGGNPVTPTVDEGHEATTVSFDTGGATGPITLSYAVHGAAREDATGATLVRWRLLQGLDATVKSFTATVGIPTMFTSIDCFAGAPNSQQTCRAASAGTEGTTQPTFADGPRGPGEVVGIELLFPAGAVAVNEEIDHRWTLGRAFSAGPAELIPALALLVLGALGLWLAHRRTGSDASISGDPVRIAEFAPVGEGTSEFKVLADVRPGQVGTVADERVDPIDVTATIIDLAVRGHLLIEELPRRSEFAGTDWRFRRLPADRSALYPYEVRVLDAVAPEDGREVLVSRIGTTITEHVPQVQSDLYDDMVTNGWYERRPDATRNTWGQAAIVALILAVVATGVLVALTTFGLVGLALLALALGLLFVAQEMPSRTAKGSAVLAGLNALRTELTSRPTDEMPRGKELHELSEVLAYAVVLGGSDRWLQALADADRDDQPDSTDLGWYHGPDTWHLHDLPDSMRNFITTVSGNLTKR